MRRQLETAWRASGSVAASREVPVAIRIASARSDVRRVEDVAVDEADFVDEGLVEFRVPLFDVLAPEVYAFEEFRAAQLRRVGGDGCGERLGERGSVGGGG
jgi:hypothetical protein